jgi:hypothetical protein
LASAQRPPVHFLHPKDGGLLAAAGICTARKVDDDWAVSASIITRPARDASSQQTSGHIRRSQAAGNIRPASVASHAIILANRSLCYRFRA